MEKGFFIHPVTGVKTPCASWAPGMQLENANGAISDVSLGYQYAIQTTTLIRARVIEQKFYKVPFAEYIPVEVGTGAFLEDIKTNLTFDAAGSFESGIQGTSSGPTQVAQVHVGTSPRTAAIVTWAKGYQYNMVELKKALASNNWDIVESKMKALKRNWDLGLQQVAFLGLQSNSAIPGLLTNSDVTEDTDTIKAFIHSLSYSDFATLVQNLLAAYFANSNYTVLPDHFAIPVEDFLGLETPVSPQFPTVSMLEFLEKAFKKATQNPNFKIVPIAYCDQVNNAGFGGEALGKNYYVLYRNDPETLKMDIPVDMILNPAATGDNFNWNGVGVGQFTGTVIYRIPEVYYCNWAA